MLYVKENSSDTEAQPLLVLKARYYRPVLNKNSALPIALNRYATLAVKTDSTPNTTELFALFGHPPLVSLFIGIRKTDLGSFLTVH